MSERTGTGDVVLTRVASTCLYQPASPGPGEAMLFLRWNADTPPASLSLDATWAETGAPPTPGYLAFLDTMPPLNAYLALEEALRAALPEPLTTGLLWANASPVTVQTLLRTRLDSGRVPSVDGDTRLAGPPGFPILGFGDGSPVLALREDGHLAGLAVTYPPPAAGPPPSSVAVWLKLTGDGVGCARFEGLVDAIGTPATQDSAKEGSAKEDGAVEENSADKALTAVSMDPLHPLDTSRNFIRFLGPVYRLTIDGDTGSLSPVA